MKKLIAILTIMMVVFGFAFAEPAAGASSNGNAAIDITASINTEFPTFRLRAVGYGANSAAGTTDLTTPVADDVAENGANTPASVVISTNELLEKDAVINFDIFQIALSRAICEYDLEVSATKLYMTADSKGANVTQQVAEANANRHFNVSPTDITVSPATGTAVANVALDGDTAGKLNAQYNGQVVPANTTLGTFQLTWTKNSNAEAGQYKATVTLIVTAK